MKTIVIEELRKMSSDIRISCACGISHSPQELADEVEKESEAGKDYYNIRTFWEQQKHRFV